MIAFLTLFLCLGAATRQLLLAVFAVLVVSHDCPSDDGERTCNNCQQLDKLHITNGLSFRQRRGAGLLSVVTCPFRSATQPRTTGKNFKRREFTKQRWLCL